MHLIHEKVDKWSIRVGKVAGIELDNTGEGYLAVHAGISIGLRIKRGSVIKSGKPANTLSAAFIGRKQLGNHSP